MARIDDLERQLATIQGKIADEKKRIKQQKAQDHKRKIEVVGNYILEKLSANGSLSQLIQEMDQAGKLNKKADRLLFGLSTVKKQEAPTSPQV